jgi:hypothetical protein
MWQYCTCIEGVTLALDVLRADFGIVAIIALATPLISLIVKSIRQWLTRSSSAHIVLKNEDGQIIAVNIDSKDAASISRALGTIAAKGSGSDQAKQ